MDSKQDKSTKSVAVRAKSSSVANIEDISRLTFDQQLQLFETIAKSANSGVQDAGQGILIFQKAKELGIGWGNAIPHMHVVNGKTGIDIHIVKAILSRPGSGVTWECLEDFKPLYRYSDGNKIFNTEDEIPEDCIIVSKLSDKVPDGKRPVVILPEYNEKKEAVVRPYDYRTKYIFRRTKRDIDGNFIKIVSHKGVFTWNDALTAGLPIDKTGVLNPNSVWQKYRKLMLDIRAFTYGARDIASDLLMGCYEKTELLDMTETPYTITEDGEATIVA